MPQKHRNRDVPVFAARIGVCDRFALYKNNVPTSSPKDGERQIKLRVVYYTTSRKARRLVETGRAIFRETREFVETAKALGISVSTVVKNEAGKKVEQFRALDEIFGDFCEKVRDTTDQTTRDAVEKIISAGIELVPPSGNLHDVAQTESYAVREGFKKLGTDVGTSTSAANTGLSSSSSVV